MPLRKGISGFERWSANATVSRLRNLRGIRYGLLEAIEMFLVMMSVYRRF